jgi:antitoxin (DNA-binding transcriptional repressor) of toxin-antitoxin stability system
MTIVLPKQSDNLIFMKTIKMTVTQLARNLSSVFDDVELGQTVEIFRGKKKVGTLVPPDPTVPNGALLAARLKEVAGDPRVDWDDVQAIYDRMKKEEREWAAQQEYVDPWAE